MKNKTVNFEKDNISTISKMIKDGGVCVLPSDTLYGLSCSALNENAVERIYKLKGRENNKPFIILVRGISEIKKFGVKIEKSLELQLLKVWPAQFTAVFKVENKKWSYLHRETYSLAFRIPNNTLLLELLAETGPITSTTVNLSGKKPSETIKEAFTVFKQNVDLYVEHGRMVSTPSTIVSFVEKKPTIIREGTIEVRSWLKNSYLKESKPKKN
jgi:L-threonylcarbamoyladenylate synthase